MEVCDDRRVDPLRKIEISKPWRTTVIGIAHNGVYDDARFIRLEQQAGMTEVTYPHALKLTPAARPRLLAREQAMEGRKILLVNTEALANRVKRTPSCLHRNELVEPVVGERQ